ncbi:MAG: hypothetical protein O3A25_16440 [Acidobacteria bacterium]|nr:hypothetical protein [Acidobacteriota bacterium]
MTPAEIRTEIKRLYNETTRVTIERDLARAVTLLKALDGEEERARVAVYMDGLSQMRSEWIIAGRRVAQKKATAARKGRKQVRR